MALMILNDRQLRDWAKTNVNPLDPDCINPASLDLKLGDEFIDLELDKPFHTDLLTIRPGDAILAATLEYIRMPTDCAGVLYLKSSLARQGLDHALAGFVDPGFHGQLTLELHCHRPVKLHAGQRIVQLVLYECYVPERPYDGRYQGQRGPTR